MPFRRLTAWEKLLVARVVQYQEHNRAYRIFGEARKRTAAKLCQEGFMLMLDVRTPVSKSSLRYVAVRMTLAGRELWAMQPQFAQKTFAETRYGVPWEAYDIIEMAKTMSKTRIAQQIGVSHSAVYKRIEKLTAETW